ncbi:MAG: hypothetical protein AB1630_09685 [bacterium]
MKDTLYPEDFEKETEHIERLIRWFSKFGVKKRLEIGYKHTLAAIKLSKLKKDDKPFKVS